MSRGTAGPTGVVVLVAITVLAGAAVVGLAPTMADSPSIARLTLDAEAAQDRVALTHEGGDTLDVDAATVRIDVDGEPLAEQPPVPFFAASGFASGPTGPFNEAGSTTWRAGETAALELASTNAPAIEPGSTVRVRVSVDGYTVADERVRAS